MRIFSRLLLICTLTLAITLPVLAAKNDRNDLKAASRSKDPVIRQWAQKQLGKFKKKPAKTTEKSGKQPAKKLRAKKQ